MPKGVTKLLSDGAAKRKDPGAMRPNMTSRRMVMDRRTGERMTEDAWDSRSAKRTDPGVAMPRRPSLKVPARGTTSRGSFYHDAEGNSRRPDADQALQRAGYSRHDTDAFVDRAIYKSQRDSTINALMARRDSVNAEIENRLGDMVGDEARSARRDSMKARASISRPNAANTRARAAGSLLDRLPKMPKGKKK